MLTTPKTAIVAFAACTLIAAPSAASRALGPRTLRAPSPPRVAPATTTEIDLALAPADAVVHSAAEGDLLGDRTGLVVTDLDGDGQVDLVVSASRGDGTGATRPNAGEVHVLRGPLDPAPRDLAVNAADVTILGAEVFDFTGWSLAVADFSGDGVKDLAIGVLLADGPAAARRDAGSVVVLFGPFADGIIDLATHAPDFVVLGARSGDFLGAALSAGDLTGDGVNDLLIGARGQDGPASDRPNAGAAYVVAGPLPSGGSLDLAVTSARFTLLGADEGDSLGLAVLAADVNADGVLDLVAAAPSASGPDDLRFSAGEVHVVRGPLPVGVTRDLALTPADSTVLGAREGDQLGASLSSGELSGDAHGDLVMGAMGSDGPDGSRFGAGAAFVGFAPLTPGVRDLAVSADATLFGAHEGDGLGFGTGVGDVTADGRADLLAGALGTDGPDGSRFSAGALVAAAGPLPPGGVVDTAVDAPPLRIHGAVEGDLLGECVAVADVSGDGRLDVVVVARTSSGPDGQRGGAGSVQAIFAHVSNTDPSCDVAALVAASCREAVVDAATVTDAEGDELHVHWSSSDPRVAVDPADEVVAAGDGVRLLSPVVVTLAEGVDPCGFEAELLLEVDDGRGGTSSCVVPSRFHDDEVPALVGVPGSMAALCGSTPDSPSVSAVDACDAAPHLELSETRADGGCPQSYQLVRTWTATDACGNSTSATQVVDFHDDEAPVVDASSRLIATLWPPDHRMVHFASAVLAPVIRDACGSEVTWSLSACTSNQSENGPGAFAPDCVIDADGSGFSVRAERDGSDRAGRTYSLGIVARDACGNESSPTLAGVVRVPHSQAPPKR